MADVNVKKRKMKNSLSARTNIIITAVCALSLRHQIREV